MHSKCVFVRVGDCTSSVIDPEHGERNDSFFVICSIQHRSMKGEYRYRDELRVSRLSSWLRRVDKGLHVHIQITFTLSLEYIVRGIHGQAHVASCAIARQGAEYKDHISTTTFDQSRGQRMLIYYCPISCWIIFSGKKPKFPSERWNLTFFSLNRTKDQTFIFLNVYLWPDIYIS